MKMKKMIGLFVAGAYIAFGSIMTEAADRLDTYRNLIMNRTYTIRCESITSEPRVTNRDRYYTGGKNRLALINGAIMLQSNSVIGRSGINTSDIGEYTYKPMKCFVTAEGNKHYMETSAQEDFASCVLDIENESFKYTRVKKDGTVTYVGTKKNTVVANDFNYENELKYGQGMGTADVTRLINAMLPEGTRPAGEVEYEKITEDSLDNGLNYIDYRGEMPNGFELIRYYFRGNTLVKIASGIYTLNNDGRVIDGRRCIVKITEFKSMPEREYLKLPEGVKGKTVRKKDDKSK